MKKKVLVVHPTPFDKRELGREPFCSSYDLIFPAYDARLVKRALVHANSDLPEPCDYVERMVSIARAEKVAGVFSTEDYPGPIIAAVVAQECGLLGPVPRVVIECQHKWYARLAQKKYVPEAVPHCALVDTQCDAERLPPLAFPFFIKPVKAMASCFAQVIHNEQQYRQLLKTFVMPQHFLSHLNWFLREHTTRNVSANYLLAEELLEGVQVTVEGFLYKGRATILGITDSVMFPGTLCFKRFEYPSRLPQAVQARMEEVAKTYSENCGLDMTLFNIELMYNPATDKIAIIEINPRMASQFADLYEKVDGTNAYRIALDLALGVQPTFERGKGDFSVAASFVLRTFSDKRVKALPSPEDLLHVSALFSDIRWHFFVKPGQKLSDELQDGASYRYGWVQLGGMDWDDLYKRFAHAERFFSVSFASL